MFETEEFISPAKNIDAQLLKKKQTKQKKSFW